MSAAAEPLDLDAIEERARYHARDFQPHRTVPSGAYILRTVAELAQQVESLVAEARQLREQLAEERTYSALTNAELGETAGVWVYGWLHPGDPISSTITSPSEYEARECARIVGGTAMRSRPFGWEPLT